MSDAESETVPTSVGEEWIYRLRDTAPSERVRIVHLPESKKSPRFEIEFLDGDKAGSRLQSPGLRLRGPWSDVEAYDALMDSWDRLDEFDLTETEEFAATEVFSLLIPEKVAEWEWNPVHYATKIKDIDALTAFVGVQREEFLEGIDSFVLGDVIMTSRHGTLRIAELACKQNPTVVLDWILQEEAKLRRLTKRGGTFGLSNKDRDRATTPEWEWQWYREHHLPKHELLRQWCGHRAITIHERLVAAEAEVQRLDVIVATLIDLLKEREPGSRAAESMEEEFERERITPATIRPLVERPLDISEIPVRYERARRRWA